MERQIDVEFPLKEYFSIPLHLHRKDIACIRAVSNPEELGPNLSVIINALRSKGYRDLSSVLNSSWKELYQVRLIGYKRQILLLELLERISADPEVISNYKIAPRVTKRSKKKMAELELKRIIKRYRKTPEELLKEEELAAKEVRLQEIKDKLRKLGLIQ
jgi:hypothetical protein